MLVPLKEWIISNKTFIFRFFHSDEIPISGLKRTETQQKSKKTLKHKQKTFKKIELSKKKKISNPTT